MKPEEVHALVLFELLSPEQLQWLIENSTEVNAEVGERIFTQNTDGDALWVLVEGEWRLSRKMDGVETTIVTTDYAGSWAGGIPLLTGDFQATGHAVRPSRFLKIPNEAVSYMLSNGFPIAKHLIAGISVGARNLEGQMREREKMAALGKLSAGLAHELNNPAAAGRRAASQMRDTLKIIQSEALKLNQHLNPTQLTRLAEFQTEIMERAKTPPRLGSLEQSEREDELSTWLEDHQIEAGWQIAPGLVEAGADQAWLEGLATEIGLESLGDVLNWLVAGLEAVGLLNQLENSTERISTLVKAVKEYSYMDQAPQQNINIHDGLESTLTILAHKLKNGVIVIREYDQSLPKISAFGSELNQVWTNLIDNAIDAIKGQGQIWVRTSRDENYLVVEIADNGPGIPPDIQPRIFEPFFTTKGVGEGSGIGLDVVYRIVVTRHKGEVKVISQPGDTRFQIRLPIN